MSTKGYIAIIATFIVLVGLMIGIQKFSSSDQPLTAGSPPPKAGAPSIHMDPKRLAAVWPQIIRHAAGPARGNAKAPYAIVEIGDFQCPNCAVARPLLEKALQDSGGHASLYFINFPLASIHPHALAAAEAGLEASSEGQFWPMYDMLYDHRDTLIPSEIQYNSRDIPGVNPSKIANAMKSQTYDAKLRQSVSFCTSIGIGSTPTVLVRGPKGDVSIFIGTGGGDYMAGTVKQHAGGVIDLAANPPWGNGMGHDAALQLAKATQQTITTE